jgi:transcriptional regulator with XRE-family HTH domain
MPSHQMIRERRRLLRLTQDELALRLRKIGLPYITYDQISKIERGKRMVPADEVPYFAAALDCEITDLHDPKPQ